MKLAVGTLSAIAALYRVPNSTPGRDSVDLEIFGMEGVPHDAINARLRGDEGDPFLSEPPYQRIKCLTPPVFLSV